MNIFQTQLGCDLGELGRRLLHNILKKQEKQDEVVECKRNDLKFTLEAYAQAGKKYVTHFENGDTILMIFR